MSSNDTLLIKNIVYSYIDPLACRLLACTRNINLSDDVSVENSKNFCFLNQNVNQETLHTE